MMLALLPLAMLEMATGLAGIMVSFGIEAGVAALYAIAAVGGMTWALWPRPSDKDDFL